MKLSHFISIRIIGITFCILCIWSSIFYFGVVNEVTDETDDVLEDFSTMLIQRSLAGEELPSVGNGSNNTYSIVEVSEDFAQQNMAIKFSDEKVFIEYKSENEPARVITRIFKNADDQYFQISVSTPTIDKGDMIMTISLMIFALFLLLFMIIGLTNTAIVHRSTKPLRDLLKWMDKRDIDKTNDTFEADTRIEEFQRLSTSINSFVQHNARIFDQQKEFIANASHELQTPIAVCQNRLELMMDSDLNEEQAELLGKSLATLQDISKLNRSLLLLSKIEHGEFTNTKVEIGEIIKEGVENGQDIYVSNDIKIEWLSFEKCEVDINPSLAQILVNNLIKNAFMHSTKHATISISLSSKEFRITNTGLDVALNEGTIFERFRKSSQAKGSSGLGLAIVGAICKLYKYKVGYSFLDKKHSFYIKF